MDVPAVNGILFIFACFIFAYIVIMITVSEVTSFNKYMGKCEKSAGENVFTQQFESGRCVTQIVYLQKAAQK